MRLKNDETPGSLRLHPIIVITMVQDTAMREGDTVIDARPQVEMMTEVS